MVLSFRHSVNELLNTYKNDKSQKENVQGLDAGSEFLNGLPEHGKLFGRIPGFFQFRFELVSEVR